MTSEPRRYPPRDKKPCPDCAGTGWIDPPAWPVGKPAAWPVRKPDE
jgi:hypothetical protein